MDELNDYERAERLADEISGVLDGENVPDVLKAIHMVVLNIVVNVSRDNAGFGDAAAQFMHAVADQCAEVENDKDIIIEAADSVAN